MNTNISDEQALEVLHGTVGARAQSADTFATRTILYPVEVERKKGEKKVEIRPYVIMRQYYPERKWQKALDVEKRYKKLNEDYRKSLKARGLPTDAKEIANPLNATPIEFK
jgi:hypothetical protein